MKRTVSLFAFFLFVGIYTMADDLLDNELLELAVLGSPDEIAAVIAKGAKIETNDPWGETALILAAGNGKTDNVKLLLAKGADINATSRSKSTALMRAAAKGFSDVVNVLLLKKADVNKKNIKGFTAIMMASGQGYADIVKSLLKHGANVNLKNNDGQTALDLATYEGHMEIVKLLKPSGATSGRMATSRKHKLPEPSGPNLIELVPLKQYSIRRLFVATSEDVAKNWPAEWPSTFPSGTKKLELFLGFDIDPAYGVRLNTVITSKSGKLNLRPQGPPGRFNLFGEFYLTQDIEPAAGQFGDGVYQCVIQLNSVNIAQLSWSVGSKEGS